MHLNFMSTVTCRSAPRSLSKKKKDFIARRERERGREREITIKYKIYPFPWNSIEPFITIFGNFPTNIIFLYTIHIYKVHLHIRYY